MITRDAGRPAGMVMRISVCSFLLFSAACATGPAAMPGVVNQTPVESLNQTNFASAVADDYVIRPSDVLQINVFREDALSLPSVAVAADGSISVPLLGSMNVAGQTLAAIEQNIERGLGARYLQNPEVAVNIITYASHVVTVEGAVESAGIYTFLPGTRMSGGISLAEGPERTARISDVAIFRETGGAMQIAKFDLRAVRAGTMLDPVLQPGDRIVVGTDGLSVLWQDALKALPAFAIFTQI